MSDLRYAFRTFARSPLFALTAVLSIAIGIGVDTTVFSVANAVLLRPLPGVQQPDAIVALSRSDEDRFGVDQISFPNFVDVRERATTLTDFFGYEPAAEPMSLSIGGRAERAYGHRVTSNYFAALGVSAQIGHVFDREPGTAADSVVLSHKFWMRRFHGDPSIVGTTITINTRRATIVGVTPEEFSGTSLLATDLWTALESVPFEGSFLTRRDLGWALVGARVTPGSSVSAAAAEMEAIANALAREYPETNAGRGFHLAPASLIPGNLSVPLAGVLTLLLGFVSLVLVIACANLAGLLVTRAVVRRREIAVRVAIGAGRGHLIKQLLTEVTVLFAAGAAAGVVLAYMLTTAIEALMPMLPVPIAVSVGIDTRVLAFTAALSSLAALACGLGPALQTSRPDVASTLKEEGHGTARRMRLRNASVICQVAASVVLVAATAVFVRALERATAIDPGFDPRGVELAAVDLSLAGYTPETGRPFIRDLAERIRTLPAIEASTITAVTPADGTTRFGMLSHPGTQPGSRGGMLQADWNAVEPGYFQTLRIPIVRGRDFTAADTATREPVIIVSEEAARRFWPGENPIDKFLLQHPSVLRRGETNASRPLRVVGVARNVNALARGTPRAHVYLPLQQQYVPAVTIAARASDGRRLDRELAAAIGERNANLPVLNSQTLEEAMSFALVLQRVAAIMSSALGFVALILAAIGLYGLVAYTVVDRTREIGVRMALGAQRRQIVSFVLRGAAFLTLIGGGLGIVVAVAAHWTLARLIYGFPAVDPLSFAAAIVVFAVITLGATYFPVRRALTLDPATTLRYE